MSYRKSELSTIQFDSPDGQLPTGAVTVMLRMTGGGQVVPARTLPEQLPPEVSATMETHQCALTITRLISEQAVAERMQEQRAKYDATGAQ